MVKGKVSIYIIIYACYTSVSTKPEVDQCIAGLSLGVSCEKVAIQHHPK